MIRGSLCAISPLLISLASPAHATTTHYELSVEVFVYDQNGDPVADSLARLAWDDGRSEPVFVNLRSDAWGRSAMSVSPSVSCRPTLFRATRCKEPQGSLIVCARASGYKDVCRTLGPETDQSVILVLKRGSGDEA